MGKKKLHSKTTKYHSFKLHGTHEAQKVFLYVVFDLAVSSLLGLILHAQIIQALASS
jgi:uncharacterized membrane protein YraQ (UPF0718 family)